MDLYTKYNKQDNKNKSNIKNNKNSSVNTTIEKTKLKMITP